MRHFIVWCVLTLFLLSVSNFLVIKYVSFKYSSFDEWFKYSKFYLVLRLSSQQSFELLPAVRDVVSSHGYFCEVFKCCFVNDGVYVGVLGKPDSMGFIGLKALLMGISDKYTDVFITMRGSTVVSNFRISIARVQNLWTSIYSIYFPIQIFVWGVSSAKYTVVISVISCVVFWSIFMVSSKELTYMNIIVSNIECEQFRRNVVSDINSLLFGDNSKDKSN